MIKPYFRPTSVKPVAAPTASPLPNLYHQQRTLTAAKNVTTDPHVQTALGQKQSMLSRRIAHLQAQEKTK